MSDPSAERLNKIHRRAERFVREASSKDSLVAAITLLLGELVDLEARLEQLEREKLARFGRSVTFTDAEIDSDDPWTGVVGFFTD